MSPYFFCSALAAMGSLNPANSCATRSSPCSLFLLKMELAERCRYFFSALYQEMRQTLRQTHPSFALGGGNETSARVFPFFFFFLAADHGRSRPYLFPSEKCNSIVGTPAAFPSLTPFSTASPKGKTTFEAYSIKKGESKTSPGQPVLLPCPAPGT